MRRNEERRGFVTTLTMGAFLFGYGLLLLTGVTNLRHLIDNIIASYLLGWALYGMFARVPLAEVGTRFLLTTGSLMMCWASSVLINDLPIPPLAWSTKWTVAVSR